MNVLNSSTRVEKPEIVIDNQSLSPEGDVMLNYIVNFNFEQIINRQNKQVWQFNFVCIPSPLSYNLILSSLIKAMYSDEDALAIALNYNNPLDSQEKQAEHAEEYTALQQWRANAKTIAREAMEYAISQNFQIADETILE